MKKLHYDTILKKKNSLKLYRQNYYLESLKFNNFLNYNVYEIQYSS